MYSKRVRVVPKPSILNMFGMGATMAPTDIEVTMSPPLIAVTPSGAAVIPATAGQAPITSTPSTDVVTTTSMFPTTAVLAAGAVGLAIGYFLFKR